MPHQTTNHYQPTTTKMEFENKKKTPLHKNKEPNRTNERKSIWNFHDQTKSIYGMWNWTATAAPHDDRIEHNANDFHVCLMWLVEQIETHTGTYIFIRSVVPSPTEWLHFVFQSSEAWLGATTTIILIIVHNDIVFTVDAQICHISSLWRFVLSHTK